MSGGKLLRCGTVQELTMQDETAIEIVAVGAELAEFNALPETIPSLVSTSATPNGIQILINNEADIEKALALVRQCNGHIASINPKRRPLEDIFAKTRPTESQS